MNSDLQHRQQLEIDFLRYLLVSKISRKIDRENYMTHFTTTYLPIYSQIKRKEGADMTDEKGRKLM